jgi:hypothetical protein
MLNLTTTSRKRLGLVFENKWGKKKRKQQEQDEQDINHSDSEDPDVDQVDCAICSKPTYSVANPILLCDGEGCGKGWHLSCLSRPAQSTAKKAIKEDANWFCSKRCEGLQRHEFESIVDHRAKTLHGTTTVEYLIRWKGCPDLSWEPEANIDRGSIDEYKEAHTGTCRPGTSCQA